MDRTLAIQLEIAKRLLAAISADVDGDADLALDMIEGETDLLPAVDAALARRAELLAMAEAIDQQVAKLRARKERMLASSERIEGELHSALTAIGQTKLTRPSATLSIRQGSQRAEVDETVVPQQYHVAQPPKVDRASVLAALKNGAEIPGARLVRGAPSLTIRVA